MMSYLTGLVLIAGSLALFSRGAVERCASVIIANWVAQFVYNDWLGTFTPWGWFTIIDAISAIVILWMPAGRWQAILGGTYVAQIVCHFIYAKGGLVQHDYWQVLTNIAWLQLILLGVWGYGSGASRFAVRWRSEHPHKTHNGGLG